MKVLVHPDYYVEKSYVLDLILSEILGLKYMIQQDHRVNGYQFLLPNGKRLVLEDHFWRNIKKQETYLQTHYLPKSLLKTTISTHELKAGFGVPEIRRDHLTMVLRLDIIATAFLVLTGWEETISTTRDKSGRVPMMDTFVGKNKLFATPIIHEYAAFILDALQLLGITQTQKVRSFRWVPTHDVDFITLWPNKWSKLKNIAGDLLKRRNFAYTKYMLREAPKLQHDPYHNFAYLNQVCHKYNVDATYYFMSSGENYAVTDPLLKILIQGVKKEGHQIGFHPGIKAGIDQAKFNQELKLFKQNIFEEVRDVRPHFLSYSPPQTWTYWHDACLTRDSSFCYADHSGFKCGMVQPFPLFNVIKRKKLNVYEHPLIFMDRHLIKNNIPKDNCLDYIKNYVDLTRKYGGDFTFLWHNSSFHIPEWQPYSHVFESIFEL